MVGACAFSITTHFRSGSIGEKSNAKSEKADFDTLSFPFFYLVRMRVWVFRTTGSSQAEQSWKAQRATLVSAWRTSAVPKDTPA